MRSLIMNTVLATTLVTGSVAGALASQTLTEQQADLVHGRYEDSSAPAKPVNMVRWFAFDKAQSSGSQSRPDLIEQQVLQNRG